MGSVYIITAAIFILGGAIAAVGDRVGSKVGKARLRLGKLRPRQTATLVTVATGTLISASTFGILLATDASLREVILRSGAILKELERTRAARDRAIEELGGIRDELEAADTELVETEWEKAAIQQELDEARVVKAKTQQELDRLTRDFEDLQTQASELQAQASGLRTEINTLTQERQELVNERRDLQEQIQSRDRELVARRQEIATQEQELQQSAERLSQLETQRQGLQAEIRAQEQEIARLNAARANLEQSVALERTRFDALREGRVAYTSGEPLVTVAVRGVNLESSAQFVNDILLAAEREALQRLRPAVETGQVIQIRHEEVERLRAQIADGRDYVVSILSTKNYLRGEPNVRVFPIVLPNREVFRPGDVVATVAIDRNQALSKVELGERLEKLFEVTQLRVRSEELIDKETRFGDENFALSNFVDRLQELDLPIDSIETIASEKTLLSGPLKVDFVARHQGRIVLSSSASAANDEGSAPAGASTDAIDDPFLVDN